MNKFRTKRFIQQKNESVSDPHELLLSLVDMGSIDSDEMLLACVSEMSDAECKRVLNSLCLPNCCDYVEEPEEDMSVEVDDLDDVTEPSDKEPAEDIEFDEEDEVDNTADDEAEDEAELEARIRKLERSINNESRRRFGRM